MTQISRLALVLAAIVVTATACSSGSTNAQSNYVEVDQANGTVSTVFNPVAPDADSQATLATQPATAAADVTSTEAPVPDASTPYLAGFYEFQVRMAIEEFTALRDQVEAGTAHPADLEAIAAPDIVARVADARALNLDHLESSSPQARQEFLSFPSIVDAQVEGDRIAAVSCTERWGLRTSDQWQAVLVDEVYIFAIVDGELRLTEHHVAHDGQRSTEGLTCIGGVFGERAIDGARRGVEVLDQIEADPRSAKRIDFSENFSGIALESMLTAPDVVDADRRRVTPVETRYTPVGIDPSKGWDFIAVVSVCRFYPDGIYDIDANGAKVRVDPDHGPGTSIETLVYVHIEPESRDEGGSETFWDFQPGVSEGCWS